MLFWAAGRIAMIVLEHSIVFPPLRLCICECVSEWHHICSYAVAFTLVARRAQCSSGVAAARGLLCT